MKIAKVAHVTKNQIYQIPGEIYDEDRPEFDCYMPEYTGYFWIVDCLICDKNGNLHPDIQKGVPVYTEHMKRNRRLNLIMNITTDGYTKLYLSSNETKELLSDLRHLPSELSESTTFYLEHLEDSSRKNRGSEIMMSKHFISELLVDLNKLRIKLRPITKLIIHHLEYISPYY